MKVGVVLPQFVGDAKAPIELAMAAEQSGIDGVFATDHLWNPNIGHGTALAPMPLLASVAARTERIRLGTLVTRVGVVPDVYLVRQFETLSAIAGGRIIAGLGIGDAKSRIENDAYGIAWPDKQERIERLQNCCELLKNAGHEVWVGGRSAAIRAVAVEQNVALNIWSDDPADVSTSDLLVTWGGPVEMDVDVIARRLRTARRIGATWAVVVVKGSGKEPTLAVETLREAMQHL